MKNDNKKRFTQVDSSNSSSLIKNKELNELDEERIINAVLKKAAYKIKKEKNLLPVGDGAQALDEIKMLALSFFYYKEKVSIEEARELILSSVVTFLDEINQNKKIRPFLVQYPFKIENLEIKIFFYKPDGTNVNDDSLTLISIRDGILKFKVEDPKDDRLETIYTETYEKALTRPQVSFEGLKKGSRIKKELGIKS